MIRPDGKETWEEAARIVQAGGLVVFPTDTVYGIGCDPYDEAAIARVFEVKSRSNVKALPLLLSDVGVVDKATVGRHTLAEALGAAFWPGALTLVLPKSSELPDALGSPETIAVRVPDHDGLRYMIRLCGGAIAATSANLSGMPDARNAEEADAYLGSKVDLIVDGGKARGGVPSTVVTCLTQPPSVLREGAISEAKIRQALREASAL
jgi:L-threonylcarbamoyladenylate synthase